MIGVAFLLVIVLGILAIFLAWLSVRASRRADENRNLYESSSRMYEDLHQEVEHKEEVCRDKARRRYVTPSLKRRVLERDDYTCQICGISKGYLDSLSPGLGDYLLLEVDHIVSVKNGGSGDDESNLQTLCWRCNRKKSGSRTNDDVRGMIDWGADRLAGRVAHEASSDAVIEAERPAVADARPVMRKIRMGDEPEVGHRRVYR